MLLRNLRSLVDRFWVRTESDMRSNWKGKNKDLSERSKKMGENVVLKI